MGHFSHKLKCQHNRHAWVSVPGPLLEFAVSKPLHLLHPQISTSRTTLCCLTCRCVSCMHLPACPSSSVYSWGPLILFGSLCPAGENKVNEDPRANEKSSDRATPLKLGRLPSPSERKLAFSWLVQTCHQSCLSRDVLQKGSYNFGWSIYEHIFSFSRSQQRKSRTCFRAYPGTRLFNGQEFVPLYMCLIHSIM